MSQDPSMLTEGHQLRLICDAPGSMKVDYQWIKNNEVISNNKELFFERFNRIASGNYVCNVSNGYISKFSFVQLVAHCKIFLKSLLTNLIIIFIKLYFVG